MNGEKRQLSPAWTLFILTGLNLFNYLDRSVLSAVLPSLQKDLGLDDNQGGTLGTAFMLGYFVTSPVFGFLGDRMPRKWLIALGIFVWSLGTVLSGFANGFWNLLWFRVLVGVGEASYATISPSVIADKFFGTQRNTAITIFYVAIPVGAALGFVIGGQIASHWSWRHAFIWAGAPGLLLALLLLPFADTPRAGIADKVKPTVRDALYLFRSPNYMLVVLGYTAYTFALGGFQHWGQSFLVREHGLTLDRAGNFFGLTMVVAGLIGTFLGGMLASAWHKRTSAAYAWLLGWSVLAAAPCAFLALTIEATPLAMALLSLTMFLLFLSMGPVNTLILETAPAHLRASAMAVSIFMIHLFGDLWSPKIVGAISKHSSLGHGVLVLPIALIPAALLWLALAMRLRQPLPRHRRAP
jgi:MFS transporter, Spinster family, sphingosine-1-phosphate transporter